MTRASLRTQVRLYRRQVDGAGDEIRRLLTEAPELLASALVVSPDSLPTTVSAFAAMVEARDTTKADSSRERAEHLALRLAGGCRYTLTGIALPLAWLSELALVGGFDVLGFRFGDNEACGVDRRLLAATLRELRTVAVERAEIIGHAMLRLAYQGRVQRGAISLHLGESLPGRNVVIVDLGTLLPSHEPQHTPLDPSEHRRLTKLASHGAVA